MSKTIEQIIGVAAKHETGLQFWQPRPMRHCDLIMDLKAFRDHTPDQCSATWSECTEGFVTDKGRFLDREQAWKLASENGQLIAREDLNVGTLYSEDLW